MFAPFVRPVGVAIALALAVSLLPAGRAAAAASHLHIEAVPAGDWVAGAPGTLVVSARNADDTIDTDYRWPVWFTSLNPNPPVLPVAYTFTAADAGVHAFSLTLTQAGANPVAIVARGLQPPDTITGGAVYVYVVAAPPAKLGFLFLVRYGGPHIVGMGDIFAGQPFDQQPLVQVLDAYDNVNRTVPVTVTLSPATDNAGTLSCAKGNSRTTELAVAAFHGCAIDAAGTGVRLVASAPGLEPGLTDLFDVGATVPPDRRTPSLPASVAPVTYGQHPSLPVSIQPGAHTVVLYTLKRGAYDWDWYRMATTQVDGSGHGTFDVQGLNENRLYQACYPFGGTCGNVIPVNVRFAVTLGPRPRAIDPHATAVQTVRVGETVMYSAKVLPVRHEVQPTVTFTLYKMVNGKWVLSGKPKTVAVDGSGTAHYKVTWPRGEWYVKAVANATPYNAAGSSLPIRSSVH